MAPSRAGGDKILPRKRPRSRERLGRFEAACVVAIIQSHGPAGRARGHRIGGGAGGGARSSRTLGFSRSRTYRGQDAPGPRRMLLGPGRCLPLDVRATRAVVSIWARVCQNPQLTYCASIIVEQAPPEVF